MVNVNAIGGPKMLLHTNEVDIDGPRLPQNSLDTFKTLVSNSINKAVAFNRHRSFNFVAVSSSFISFLLVSNLWIFNYSFTGAFCFRIAYCIIMICIIIIITIFCLSSSCMYASWLMRHIISSFFSTVKS